MKLHETACRERHLESVVVMRVRPLVPSWSWSALIQTLEVGLPGMCFELVFDSWTS